MGNNAETAVLAGGCAWIMQMLLRHPEGVIATRAGFMGGENDNPTEEETTLVMPRSSKSSSIPRGSRIEDYWRCSSRSIEPILVKASSVRSIAPRSSTPVRSNAGWPKRWSATLTRPAIGRVRR